MKEFVRCAKCRRLLTGHEAIAITVTIAPRIVIHYHPECYDPWLP